MHSRRKRAPADKSAHKSNGGAAIDGALALADAPGHLLRRCQQRAVEIFMAEIGAARVTPRQFAILLTLARRPGITQTDLVVETGIDRSTMAEMIARLARRGLVRRRRSGRDQRANTLAILPAGSALLKDAMPAVARAQERIMLPLPPDMRQDFIAALRLMAGDSVPDAAAAASAAPRRRG